MHRRPRDSRMSSGSPSHRLPIFQDDLSFQDRHHSLFDDLQRRMDEDFGSMGFGASSGLGRHRPMGLSSRWDDDIDSMCKDFFELKPRHPKLGKISKEGEFGSRESLDDDTAKNLFLEDPDSKTRMFQMSFNVQEYSPEDIAVRVKGDTVEVEAKHEDAKGSNKSMREFHRTIAIPKEVDPDKLTSSMSNDGILTIKAPVPPTYQALGAPASSASALPAPPLSTSNYSATAPSSSVQYSAFPSTTPAPAHFEPPAPSNFQSSNPLSPPATAYQPPPTYGATYQPYQTGAYPLAGTTQPRMSAPLPQMGGAQPMPPNVPLSVHTTGLTSPPPAAFYPPHPMQPPYSQPPLQPMDFPPPPPADYLLQQQQQQQQQAPPSQPASAAGRSTPPLDAPTYTDTPTGRRMDLVLYLGPPYTPDDILVKVDGKTLLIEAVHEEKKDNKASKASMSREFELAEDINPQTVQANLTNDGRLKLAAMAPLPAPAAVEGEEPAAPAPATATTPASAAPATSETDK